jgi:hypothetical protein
MAQYLIAYAAPDHPEYGTYHAVIGDCFGLRPDGHQVTLLPPPAFPRDPYYAATIPAALWDEAAACSECDGPLTSRGLCPKCDPGDA